MVEFKDSSRWTLVNGHTIHTDHQLHDRPLMLTSVPKMIEIEVSRHEVVRFIEWPDFEDRTQHPGTYVDRSYLRLAGNLKDRIVVFEMEGGELGSYDLLSDVTIRPAKPGSVGGQHLATSFDGIGYSGISSRTVPEGGLMAGEPGRMHYLPDRIEEGREPEAGGLSVTVYLDEDKLAPLLADIAAHSDRLNKIRLHLLVELFESETSASLSEPWHRHEYGLLMRSEWSAATAARLEAISINIDEKVVGPASAAQPAPAPVVVPTTVSLGPVVSVLWLIFLGVLLLVGRAFAG